MHQLQTLHADLPARSIRRGKGSCRTGTAGILHGVRGMCPQLPGPGYRGAERGRVCMGDDQCSPAGKRYGQRGVQLWRERKQLLQPIAGTILRVRAEMTKKPRILFICTANAARSQMAEGLLRAKYGDRYEVFSAGTRQSKVSTRAIAVMHEIGIDISNHRSKNLAEYEGVPFDLAVTLCDKAHALCPKEYPPGIYRPPPDTRYRRRSPLRVPEGQGRHRSMDRHNIRITVFYYKSEYAIAISILITCVHVTSLGQTGISGSF